MRQAMPSCCLDSTGEADGIPTVDNRDFLMTDVPCMCHDAAS